MPFLRSPESSRPSSLRDLPDLLFLSSCDRKNKLRRDNTQATHTHTCGGIVCVCVCVWCYLLGCGEVRAVRSGGAVFGGGATGNVEGVRQGPALHLSQHARLVEERLEEARVAVELHQVIDLREKDSINVTGQTETARIAVADSNFVSRNRCVCVEEKC